MKMWLVYGSPHDMRKQEKEKLFYLSILLLSFVMISSIPFILINRIQPTPFIDENFHIPQAISWVKGNVTEYDPKITTPPGLYLITSVIFNLFTLSIGSSVDFLCSPFYLRLLNLIFATFSLFGFYKILTFEDLSCRKHLTSREAFWVTINLSFFPVLYLYNFFYYTDTISTFLVIMMYKSHLERKLKKASLLGLLALFVRQTNVIWVGYLIIDVFFRTPLKLLLRRRVSANDFMNVIQVFRELWRENIWRQQVTQFYYHTRLYFLLCLLFASFVVVNKGIVVGDRNAHTPVINLCQIFYFSLISLIFGLPHHLRYLKTFLNQIYCHKILTLLTFSVFVFIVHFNTMAHPYLLADNRHYSFYLWKKVYEKHYLMKYLLIPFYMFSMFSITFGINIHKRTQFWLCTSLCLVPQQLLEFRYFIIPYLFSRLELQTRSQWWHLALESVWFMFINILTLYIFITKRVYWTDLEEVQRIIW